MFLPVAMGLALAAPEDQVILNSSGEFLHWAQDSVPFRVNPNNLEEIDNDSVITAVDSAAIAWSGASDVYLELARAGDTATMGALDEENVIYFNDDWPSSPDLLALTSSWSDEEGVIVEFDLAINSKHHDWSTDAKEGACDLQNTLTHELGHAIGIDHDEANVEATMFPSSTPGETLKRDLDAGDVEVAAWLYPEHDADDLPPSNPLFACSAVPLSAAWLGIPAFFLFLRRRQEFPCS